MSPELDGGIHAATTGAFVFDVVAQVCRRKRTAIVALEPVNVGAPMIPTRVRRVVECG
jgi:hypothetical protein